MQHVTLNNPATLDQGMFSNFRRRFRELQWLLPLGIQRTILRTVARRYNPYRDWNYSHRAIFIHVPRTAGTSIAFASGAPKPHIPVSRFAAFDPSLYNKLFKFAFVRNPWDRLLSSFAHIRTAAYDSEWRTHNSVLTRFKDFESFVLALEDPKFRRRLLGFVHFRPQLDWITLPRSTEICVDFLGRFENLEENYGTVARCLNFDKELPHLNESGHRSYSDCYSSKMRQIVEDTYGLDIRALGYQF